MPSSNNATTQGAWGSGAHKHKRAGHFRVRVVGARCQPYEVGSRPCCDERARTQRILGSQRGTPSTAPLVSRAPEGNEVKLKKTKRNKLQM